MFGFSPRRFWSAQRLLRDCDADIYHSSEPSLQTYFAHRARPNRKHVVTVRDPRDLRDWRTEFALPSLNKLQVVSNFLYEANVLVSRTTNGVLKVSSCPSFCAVSFPSAGIEMFLSKTWHLCG